MAGENTYFESDGKSVNVNLTSTVAKNQVAYVEGWLGIMAEGGESDDSRAMTIDQREYQFTVPSGLSVSKGQKVYVDVTDLTGHIPDDTAYSTTSGGNKVALFKATEDKNLTTHVVCGILLPEGV